MHFIYKNFIQNHDKYKGTGLCKKVKGESEGKAVLNMLHIESKEASSEYQVIGDLSKCTETSVFEGNSQDCRHCKKQSRTRSERYTRKS